MKERRDEDLGVRAKVEFDTHHNQVTSGYRISLGLLLAPCNSALAHSSRKQPIRQILRLLPIAIAKTVQ